MPEICHVQEVEGVTRFGTWALGRAGAEMDTYAQRQHREFPHVPQPLSLNVNIFRYLGTFVKSKKPTLARYCALITIKERYVRFCLWFPARSHSNP